MDIWGEAAPGGGDFTPQLSIGLCKVNIGNLDSRNDPISPYANLDSYMEKWEEVVLAARSASNIASGSALGAPRSEKKSYSLWRNGRTQKMTKNNKKNITFLEKCKNQRTPRGDRIEFAAGAASEAAGAQKKSYSLWRNGRTQKITDFFEKRRFF